MADLSKDILLFAKEQRRMCKTFESNGCMGCELSDSICVFASNLTGTSDDMHILEVVQKWHDEHPQKTYLMDFLEKYPNCNKGDNGIPDSCRDNIYGTQSDCRCTSCEKCWHELMEN